MTFNYDHPASVFILFSYFQNFLVFRKLDINELIIIEVLIFCFLFLKKFYRLFFKIFFGMIPKPLKHTDSSHPMIITADTSMLSIANINFGKVIAGIMLLGPPTIPVILLPEHT